MPELCSSLILVCNMSWYSVIGGTLRLIHLTVTVTQTYALIKKVRPLEVILR